MYALLYVGLGGFVGAVFRFVLSSAIQGSARFPIGTLGVNILGSFTLSLITFGTERSNA